MMERFYRTTVMPELGTAPDTHAMQQTGYFSVIRMHVYRHQWRVFLWCSDRHAMDGYVNLPFPFDDIGLGRACDH
jgi:hypothetical protein